MTRDLDTPLELHGVLLSRQGLGKWMSFMTWTRLTVQWIVSDCNLERLVFCRVTCCMDYIQVLEDMLRACVLNHKGSWEEH